LYAAPCAPPGRRACRYVSADGSPAMTACMSSSAVSSLSAGSVRGGDSDQDSSHSNAGLRGKVDASAGALRAVGAARGRPFVAGGLPEDLPLLEAHLVRVGAAQALELQVLADCCVEQSHAPYLTWRVRWIFGAAGARPAAQLRAAPAARRHPVPPPVATAPARRR